MRTPMCIFNAVMGVRVHQRCERLGGSRSLGPLPVRGPLLGAQFPVTTPYAGLHRQNVSNFLVSFDGTPVSIETCGAHYWALSSFQKELVTIKCTNAPDDYRDISLGSPRPNVSLPRMTSSYLLHYRITHTRDVAMTLK